MKLLILIAMVIEFSVTAFVEFVVNQWNNAKNFINGFIGKGEESKRENPELFEKAEKEDGIIAYDNSLDDYYSNRTSEVLGQLLMGAVEYINQTQLEVEI